LTEKISSPNSPDFKNYVTGYFLGMGSVLLINDDGLNLKERLPFSCKAKPVCIIYAKLAKNLNEPLKKQKPHKRTRKHPAFEYINKWYNNFKKRHAIELLKRYYVEGYDTFCLAITPDNKEGLPLYKLLLPEHLLEYSPEKFTREQADIGVEQYFEGWLDTIRGEYGNKYMNKGDFLTFIRKIKEMVETYQVNKTAKNRGCKKLNQLFRELPQEIDITSDILHSLFDSLIKDLSKKQVISQCKFCSDFFPYRKGKKYCSLLNEGKDCGKRARNQRYYQAKGKKQLAKYRKRTRNLRAFYKEKGIDK